MALLDDTYVTGKIHALTGMTLNALKLAIFDDGYTSEIAEMDMTPFYELAEENVIQQVRNNGFDYDNLTNAEETLKTPCLYELASILAEITATKADIDPAQLHIYKSYLHNKALEYIRQPATPYEFSTREDSVGILVSKFMEI